MSRRHTLSFDMFSSSAEVVVSRDMSTDTQSRITNIEPFDNATIHCSWTAGPVGQFKVMVRNSKASPINTEDFYELNFGSTLAITGADSECQIVLEKKPGTELRLDWVSTSGSATDLQAIISASSEGA